MSGRTTIAALLAAMLILPACSSFNSGSVRNLTPAEIDVLGKTRDRLAANETHVRGALDDLGDNVLYALRQKHNLSTNIAKAQLLEAMKSPWLSPQHSETQKELALYHLFALAEAEQKELAAREQARLANIDELKKAYSSLVSSMATLIGAKEQLLVHLNQPTSTQIGVILQQVLRESSAFREALDSADNPKLQRLSELVTDREESVAKTQEKLFELLQTIE